jgi:hypothetical protein
VLTIEGKLSDPQLVKGVVAKAETVSGVTEVHYGSPLMRPHQGENE